MAGSKEIELVFESQDEGGYHVYAPDLPGLQTQGDDLGDAMTNAKRGLPSTSRACAKTASHSTAV